MPLASLHGNDEWVIVDSFGPSFKKKKEFKLKCFLCRHRSTSEGKTKGISSNFWSSSNYCKWSSKLVWNFTSLDWCQSDKDFLTIQFKIHAVYVRF